MYDNPRGRIRVRRGRNCSESVIDTEFAEYRHPGGDDDDPVSYLQQTGSILKLAELLDDGLDDDDVTEADVLALQEAAAKARSNLKK